VTGCCCRWVQCARPLLLGSKSGTGDLHLLIPSASLDIPLKVRCWQLEVSRGMGLTVEKSKYPPVSIGGSTLNPQP
jgi:hypothetical protein